MGEGHIAQGVLLAQAGLAAGLVLVKEFLGHDVVARRVVGLRHELRRDKFLFRVTKWVQIEVFVHLSASHN